MEELKREQEIREKRSQDREHRQRSDSKSRGNVTVFFHTVFPESQLNRLWAPEENGTKACRSNSQVESASSDSLLLKIVDVTLNVWQSYMVAR